MIRFEKVLKSYASGARPALHDIDLEISQGQFAYLVGASGSGKSTVIRLLLREEIATSGRITVAGRDLTTIRRREVPRLRRDLGVVFQDFRLLPDKNVYDNVAYVLHVLGAARGAVREAVPETLDVVGLTGLSRRLPHELSGGEQQRVAIARALVKKPRLLLADEPTGNLDPGTSLEIVSLLTQINEAGTTVLMATHDDSIVNHIRRRVIELDAGRIVRDEAGGAYEAPRPLVEESESEGQEPGAAPEPTQVRASTASIVLAGAAGPDSTPGQYGAYEDDEPIDWPWAPRTPHAQREAQATGEGTSVGSDTAPAGGAERTPVVGATGDAADPSAPAELREPGNDASSEPSPQRAAADRQGRTVRRIGSLWPRRSGRAAPEPDDPPADPADPTAAGNTEPANESGDRTASDPSVDASCDPPAHPRPVTDAARPGVARVRR